MYVPLWLLGLMALAFLVLLRLAFANPSTGSGLAGGDMIERQRRSSNPLILSLSKDEQAALLARPDIAAHLAAGRKIAAIRAVREASGLGLKEAKELVERGE